MDIRQLRNLVYVARHASFGVAAEKLHVTQPALSKSIRALEQSTGVRLLDRGSWGVRPTAAGQRLIEYAEAVLKLVEDASDELAATRGLQRGRIRIGGIATTMRTIIPAAARAFLQEHPSVSLTLSEELSSALQTQLLNGALDIAVMSRPRDFPHEELSYMQLQTVDIAIVADSDHPLAGRDHVPLAELCGYRWILPARPDPDRSALDTLFASARLPLPEVVCEATSSAFQISMLAGSSWLSYLSANSTYLTAPQYRLTQLNVGQVPWLREIGVATRKQGISRPLVTSFVKHLEDACGA